MKKSERFRWFLSLKIDFENQILALIDDSHFWLGIQNFWWKNQSLFVSSTILASSWNFFYQFPLTWWNFYHWGETRVNINDHVSCHLIVVMFDWMDLTIDWQSIVRVANNNKGEFTHIHNRGIAFFDQKHRMFPLINMTTLVESSWAN